MNCDQNLRDFNVNVISRFTFWVNRKFCEWQFCLFFVILREKIASSFVISHQIGEILELVENGIS